MNTPDPHKKELPGWVKIAGVILVIIAVLGIAVRIYESVRLKHSTEDNAIPTVSVFEAPRGPVTEDITLPGNVQAWHEAPIYARTNGYLKDWQTDIGAQVKAGDPIAEIETPEVDAQLRQAEADLKTAQANNDLAQSTAKRWQDLLKTNAVSKQDADDKAGAAAASEAALSSSEANLKRLQDLESFKRIVAPFDGVITARNTDTGALINAGSSGNGPELFHIAETDKLRVYIEIPETYVNAVSPDLKAELQFAEHPGETFPARLEHTADGIDPATRTLLVELEVDNDKGTLLPGGYAEVHIQLPASGTAVHLPVSALLFRAQGMQVAVVGDDNKVALKSITIGRDYGKQVEVVSGIDPGERVINNPPDSIENGQEVRIAGQDDDKDGAKDDGKDDGKDGDKGDDKSGDKQ